MNTSDGSIQQSDNPPSDGDIPRLPLETLLGGTSNPEIPLTQLKELVAFSELGTLAAASRALLLTQPTVTRGIQQLERALGVPLFDHQPNRLILTDAGRIYARRARAILELCADSVATVRGYVSAQDAAAVLSLGATLPGPIIWLDQVYKPSPGSHAYRSDDVLCPPDWVVPRLRQYSDALIFTSEEIFTADEESDGSPSTFPTAGSAATGSSVASAPAASTTGEEVESAFIGTERLAVRVNKFSDLASRRSIAFADLHDQQFLVVTDIGPWRKIIEDNIPGARFMYQQDPDSLQILQDSSSFPTFVSNLSDKSHLQNDDRVTIPIDDPANRVDVYGAYLVSQKKWVMPLLRDMTRQWPAPIAGSENH